MLFAANDAAALAILAVAGVVLIGVLILAIFFHITLMKAIQACDPRNQAMSPGLVWLGFVPCLNIAWQFVNVIQVGNSLQAEYRDRGMRCSDESCGKTLGLSYIILGLVSSGVSFAGQAASRGADEPGLMTGVSVIQLVLGIAQLVLWIMYWVKIAGFTRELNESGRRSRYDDEDDDRRGRYEDEDRGGRYDDRDDRRDDRDDDRPRERY
jgi:hypothetical protein